MSRIDIADPETLTRVVYNALLDGVITGEPFAKTVMGILPTACAYGADEADRSNTFPINVNIDDFDTLKREVVAVAIDTLMDSKGGGLNGVTNMITNYGTGFGFKIQRLKIDYPSVMAWMDKAKDENLIGSVSTETTESLIGAIMEIESDETKVYFARRALVTERLKIDTKSEAFKRFTTHYSRLLMDA